MAADAKEDRQTALDLADAYRRLGNLLQGNNAYQNIGDLEGALSSMNKAVAFSLPWVYRDSKDREALHTLASVQLARSVILRNSVPMQSSIASTKTAIATYERMISLPGVTADELSDAADGYNELGDELGLNSDESLNDTPAASAAFRQYIALNQRALSIDPNSSLAKNSLAVGQMRVAEIEMEFDPEQALKDAQIGLKKHCRPAQRRTAKPAQPLGSRWFVAGSGNALVELGRYTEAHQSMDGIVQSSQRMVAADPEDMRALTDLNVSLIQESYNYEIASNPALTSSPVERLRNLALEEKSLKQEIDITKRLLKHGPSQNQWLPYVADAEIRLGSIQSILHDGKDTTELVKNGLATWRELVSKPSASATILDDAAEDFLFAEPAALKDAPFAVSCAERAVSLGHHQSPAKLLTLAQAYHATGQYAQSRAAAREGLTLLPSPQPGSTKPRIRRLLEILAQQGF